MWDNNQTKKKKITLSNNCLGWWIEEFLDLGWFEMMTKWHQFNNSVFEGDPSIVISISLAFICILIKLRDLVGFLSWSLSKGFGGSFTFRHSDSGRPDATTGGTTVKVFSDYCCPLRRTHRVTESMFTGLRKEKQTKRRGVWWDDLF